MFGGSSEYTAFHDVGSVHVFSFFTKGTVRDMQDSNSVKMFGQAVMSSAKFEGSLEVWSRNVRIRLFNSAVKL